MKNDLKKMWQEERGVIVLMTLTAVVAVVLIAIMTVMISSASTVTRTSYGDIGGYEEGNARTLFMFPVLIVMMGVLHNILAVKILRKNGATMAKIFLFVTILVMAGSMVVMTRLLGEG